MRTSQPVSKKKKDPKKLAMEKNNTSIDTKD